MKNLKLKVMLFWGIVCGIILAIYGTSYAKYVSSLIWDYFLKTKGFYFSSDKLGANLNTTVDSNWTGESIYLEIKNSSTELIATDYDINYSVTCEIVSENKHKFDCLFNQTNNNVLEGVLSSSARCVNNKDDGMDTNNFNKTDCELAGYQWINDVAVKNILFDIVPREGYSLEDIVVNITAKSLSPYKKILKGRFILYKNNLHNEITSTYKNYSNYDRLNILNNSSNEKCVLISWDANNLVIEGSSFIKSNIDSNQYINEIKTKISSNQSTTYIFYKKNNNTYKLEDFNIKEVENCQQ